MTYEQASMRLEELIQEIEKGKISLDDILVRVEEANNLIAFCKAKLKNVEHVLARMDANEEA